MIACFIGVLCGVITGLIPGLHVNNVGALIFVFSAYFLKNFSPEVLSVFLLSLSVSHALLEFIPSMLLGVPKESTALVVHPAHKMILEGYGKKTIRLVAVGGLSSILILAFLFPLLSILLPILEKILKPYICIILILASIYLLISLNRSVRSTLISTIIFLVSGIFGILVLKLPFSSNVLLTTMFLGLFGVSTMLYSLKENSYIPYQSEIHNFKVNGNIIRGIISGTFASIFLAFLPGFGPAQGSVIAQKFCGKNKNEYESLITAISSVNVSDSLFSLLTVYLIGNARSGIAVYISQFLGEIDLMKILLFIFVGITSVSLSFFICIKIGEWMIENIAELNYKLMTIFIVVIITSFVYILSYFENANVILVSFCYFTSIFLGILPHSLKINKSYLMGCLIIPAIVMYL